MVVVPAAHQYRLSSPSTVEPLPQQRLRFVRVRFNGRSEPLYCVACFHNIRGGGRVLQLVHGAPQEDPQPR